MTEALISSLVHDAARRFRGAVATTFPGVCSLSFEEIDARAGRFASGLERLGVNPGDRVVLHLPNSWEWIVAYHAIARLGAVVVPANILLSTEEVQFNWADSEARVLIVPSARAGAITAAGGVKIGAWGEDGDVTFESVLDAPYSEPVRMSPDDLFTIGYTSGTTGRPKGAMLTHRCIFTSVAGTATAHVRHAGDVVLSSLPFPHVYGNVVMNATFVSGARLVSTPRFDAAQSFELIAQEGVTLFEGVPTMYYQMLNHPAIGAARFGSLKRCTVGGQTMPQPKIAAVEETLGCPVLELWGMTEVSGPAVTHSPYFPTRHGSVGHPFPGVEGRIRDIADPSVTIEDGSAGELHIRGPLVMKGYWRNEKATREAIDPEGWLATGDIGTMDEDGYIYIVDRKKEMIITAGYNVYPAEIEQVIASHDAVSAVAVASVPDEEKGELARAFIVLKAGKSASEEEILLHCRKWLAAYKVPRAIVFMDALPTTSSGKILRRALREASAKPGEAS